MNCLFTCTYTVCNFTDFIYLFLFIFFSENGEHVLPCNSEKGKENSKVPVQESQSATMQGLSRQDTGAPWSCSSCTFINKPTSTCCEICCRKRLSIELPENISGPSRRAAAAAANSYRDEIQPKLPLFQNSHTSQINSSNKYGIREKYAASDGKQTSKEKSEAFTAEKLLTNPRIGAGKGIRGVPMLVCQNGATDGMQNIGSKIQFTRNLSYEPLSPLSHKPLPVIQDLSIESLENKRHESPKRHASDSFEHKQLGHPKFLVKSKSCTEEKELEKVRKPRPKSMYSLDEDISEEVWVCRRCTLENKPRAKNCAVCETPRRSNIPTSIPDNIDIAQFLPKPSVKNITLMEEDVNNTGTSTRNSDDAAAAGSSIIDDETKTKKPKTLDLSESVTNASSVSPGAETRTCERHTLRQNASEPTLFTRDSPTKKVTKQNSQGDVPINKNLSGETTPSINPFYHEIEPMEIDIGETVDGESDNWACENCTFKCNPSWTDICDICDTPRFFTSGEDIPLVDLTESDGCSPKRKERLSHILGIPSPDTSWTCVKCTLVNPCAVNVCAVCGCSKIYSTSMQKQKSLPSFSMNESWDCKACTLKNSSKLLSCEACGKQRPLPPVPKSPPVTSSKDKRDGWSCTGCTYLNSENLLACSVCGKQKPGALVRVPSLPGQHASDLMEDLRKIDEQEGAETRQRIMMFCQQVRHVSSF